ncbi:MAG: hypothetical protein ACXABM_17160 [Candidatus Thorarchaeota archaeon]|jgi:hypothetical protein
MLHQPGLSEEDERSRHKRRERIVAASTVISAVSFLLGVGIGLGSAMTPGGNVQLRQISMFFIGVWILSMIPIGYYIVKGIIYHYRLWERKKGLVK